MQPLGGRSGRGRSPPPGFYRVVQGVVLVMAASYVLINLAVDMVDAFIDPRTRYD